MLLNKHLLLIKKYESRTLYRHSSGMGTVICYNDGVDREVLVLDAKYRALGNLITSRYKELSGKNINNINGNNFLNGVIGSYNAPNRFKVTDRYLNKLWSDTTYDTKTSKYNTDVLIDCTAAQYCRSIKVDGVGCDIPNIQILMRIYCEANRLDGLDPTVMQYATYAFGDVNPNGWWNPGATHDFWSSTRINDGESFMQMRFDGRCVTQYIGYDYGVCPVLEL